MGEEEPQYWVVASGDKNHDYSEIFIKYGIMAIGPGDYGDYNENPGLYKSNLKKKHPNWLKSIQIIANNDTLQKDRDYVVLRAGIKYIVAVGKVISDYLYSPALEDVFGWSPQHYRKVIWKRVEREIPKHYKFGSYHNLCHLKNKRLTYVKKTLGFDYLKLKGKNLPIQEPQKVLISKINRLVNKKFIHEMFNRIKYYKDSEHKEQEIVTFLVVPLLRKLGWKIEEIYLNEKVSKNAGFADIILRKKGDSPYCVIEVKYLDEGLSDFVKEQALDYVNHFLKNKGSDKEKFPYFMLTDGQHYYLYKSKKHEFPIAYMNLDKDCFYDSHPLFPRVKGILTILKYLKK